MTHTIGPATILPARREDIALQTAGGVTLVGELALPLERESVATLITLHPLPTHGGSMDSHVLRKAAWRLPALADLAVLRFNTRGTASPRGLSEGTFDAGGAEGYDVAAALDFAAQRDLPHRWLVGWSFGTELVLVHGVVPSIEGAFLLSPPLRRAREEDLLRWDAFGRPVTVLVPEFDDFLRPAEAVEQFAPLRQAEVVAVEGAKHLWVGESYVHRVLSEIVQRVRPGFGALPRTWDGPYEMYQGAREGGTDG